MAFFTTQRKETGSYSTKRTKPCRSRRKGKIYDEKTKDGKLTVWGAYERVILDIQNARKWADSTCRAYDSVFYHYIAEIYNHIEYASLTEETAEQIWSSKIDIFEGSDAQDRSSRCRRSGRGPHCLPRQPDAAAVGSDQCGAGSRDPDRHPRSRPR